MYIYVHAAFLLNFILKNILPKKLIKDGNWYNSVQTASRIFSCLKFCKKIKIFKAQNTLKNFLLKSLKITQHFFIRILTLAKGGNKNLD